MPIDAPNPYGGYFDFGQVQSAVGSAVPRGTPGFDTAMSRLMGQGGGFAPTSADTLVQGQMAKAGQAAMSDALRSDTRAAGLTNFVLDQLYGQDQARRSAFLGKVGGHEQAREWVSSLLNMPGISGFAGGDIRSVRLGAMSIAGGGARVGTAAGSQSMFGMGVVQNQASQAIFDAVNRRFWSGAGADNPAMTAGMNRDQIGGIMMMGSQQGAFAGLDVGSVSRAEGKMNFQLNPAAIKKIESFTTTAAKSLAALVDVFGNRSVAELGNLAQRITGLDMSSMSNVQQMQGRLNNIRATADVFGYDTRTAFDLAAGGSALGGAFGLNGRTAGAVGTFAVQQAMQQRRALEGDPGFFRVAPSTQELVGNAVRDQAAMMRDPLGSRIQATEMLIETGMIGAGQASQARKMAGGLTRGNVGEFDRFISSATGGMSVAQIVRAFGDGERVSSQLSNEGQVRASRMVDANMNMRKAARVGNLASGLFGGAGGGMASDLASTFGAKDLNSMAAAVDAGNIDEATRIAAQDPHLLKDPKAAAGMVSKLVELKGMTGSAAGSVQLLEKAIRNDSIAQGFLSRQDQLNLTRQQDKVQRVSSDQGRMLGQGLAGGSIQGFLSSVGKNTPAHRIATMMYMSGGKFVAGGGKGDFMSLQASAFESADGQLTEKGAGDFAESLTNLTRLDSTVASRLGVGKSFFQDRIGFAKANFQRITEMWSNPELRQAILHGRQAMESGARGRLLIAKDADVTSQTGLAPALHTAEAFAEAFKVNEGGNPFAVSTHRKFFESAARMIKSGGVGSPEELGQMYELVARNVDVLGRDQLSTIGKYDAQASQAIVDHLTQQIVGLEGKMQTAEGKDDKQTAAKLKDLKEKRELIEGGGLTKRENTGERFMGILQLVGADGLEIKLSKQ